MTGLINRMNVFCVMCGAGRRYALFAAAIFLVNNMAQAQYAYRDSVVTSSDGKTVMSGTGLCVKMGDFSPRSAYCHIPPLASPRVTQYVPPPSDMPAVPLAMRLSLSADKMFDSGSYNLLGTGLGPLLELAYNLSRLSYYSSVYVVGHTDRMGDDASNMQLSWNRANEVKNFLLAQGVPSAKIVVDGKGRHYPVTEEGLCQMPPSPALINCLAPDRRVEVYVYDAFK